MNGKNLRRFLTAILLVGGVTLIPSLAAQQPCPDEGFVAPRPTRIPVDTTPLEKPVPFDIAGIVAQAFNRKRPLQMINPLAPAKYGDGRDNVSWDPDKPEKPKGIILFGIQW